MLTQLLSFVLNALVIVAVIGLVLAVLSWRFRTWRPLFRLYIKSLKFMVVGIASFVWKPAFRRRGVGRLVEGRHQGEP